MSRSVRVVVMAAAPPAATWSFGWVAVPVIAAITAAASRQRTAPVDMAAAAAFAWAGLLAWRATAPAFTTLLDRLGGVFPAPGWVLVVVAVLLAAVLAWSAARVVVGLLGPPAPHAAAR
jgi:hypothetical protein